MDRDKWLSTANRSRCAEFGRAVGEAVTVAEMPSTEHDEGHDVVLLDTAGRLHVDDELMGELEAIQPRCVRIGFCWSLTP